MQRGTPHAVIIRIIMTRSLHARVTPIRSEPVPTHSLVSFLHSLFVSIARASARESGTGRGESVMQEARDGDGERKRKSCPPPRVGARRSRPTHTFARFRLRRVKISR